MPGEPEDESPEYDSGRKSYEGEFRGDLKGLKIRFGIPKRWINAASPAMYGLAYIIGVAIAILIVCLGISLIIK